MNEIADMYVTGRIYHAYTATLLFGKVEYKTLFKVKEIFETYYIGSYKGERKVKQGSSKGEGIILKWIPLAVDMPDYYIQNVDYVRGPASTLHDSYEVSLIEMPLYIGYKKIFPAFQEVMNADV